MILKCVAICRKGLEAFCAKELNGKVLFDSCIELDKDILKNKRPRIPFRILILLDKGKITKIDKSNISLNKDVFNLIVNKKDSFRITVIKQDSEISSKDYEERIGEFIHNKYRLNVELKNPDKEIVLFVSGKDYALGVDAFGDMDKRDYRVMTSNRAILPSIANAMLMLAGYKKGDTLVNVFCRDGTLAIEAALQKKGRVYAVCDKLVFLKNARTNTKIVGVDIELKKTALDYLDTDFEEKSVDILVGRGISSGKRTKMKDIVKIYDELFYQAGYVLKEKGRIVLAHERPEEIMDTAKKHGFVLKKKVLTEKGDEKLYLLLFKRKE